MTASVFFVVTVVSCVAAATDGRTSVATIDPAFESGLASLKKATGIMEGAADRSQSQWQPNLQLLLGLKATRGSKQTVSFVELTTVRPPLTNTAGEPWTPPRETNRFDWSGTNTSSKRTLEFVSSLYPVRLRVFDASGRNVNEGETTLPWELLTNSLAEACRLSLPPAPGPKASMPLDSPEAARPFFGGMISFVTLLARIQSAPALSEVCKQAHCAIRLPGLWTMATAALGGNLVLSLEPRFDDASRVGSAASDAPWYGLPVDLNCSKREVSLVEVIAGPSDGADVLLAGIRSIRARHPSKPHQEFMAQVLAAGLAREEAADGTSPLAR